MAAASRTLRATGSSRRSPSRRARSRALRRSWWRFSELGVDVRAGVHTGECEEIDGKLGGIAVHIGSRIMALAGPAEVLTTGTVMDLVAGSGASFEDRGVHELKGVEGSRQVFSLRAVETRLAEPLSPDEAAARLALISASGESPPDPPRPRGRGARCRRGGSRSAARLRRRQAGQRRSA